jgi:hypothetical protein
MLHCNARMQIILPVWQTLGEAQCDVVCGSHNSPILQEMHLHAIMTLEWRNVLSRPLPCWSRRDVSVGRKSNSTCHLPRF